MIKTKKITFLAIVMLILAMMPYSTSAVADTGRIYGSGRVETALEICSTGWSTAKTAILAPADQPNLVDALAAVSLAGQEHAPILLTPKNSLNPAVKSKIYALGVSKVYVVGAISDVVVAEMDTIPNLEIEILKGNNRWETAKAINNKLISPAGTFVIGYDALPDALSVASYAARNRYAVILADIDGRIPYGQNALGSDFYIIGGPQLVKDFAGANRIYGKDRFETNRKIIETLAYSYTKVYVANGLTNHLVDSLTAAPLAARDGAFIALTDGSSLLASSVLNSRISRNNEVIALGGYNVVSDAVREKVHYAQSVFSVQSVRALDSTKLEIRFNKSVDMNSILVAPGYDKLKHGVMEIDRNPEHDGKKDIDSDYMPAFLSSDGMTLTLRVKQGTYMDGSYILSINPGIVTSRDGEELKSYSTVINVKDNTPPSVRSVRYNSATDRIEVEMSEVCEVLPTVVVNGDDYQSLEEDSTRTVFSFPNQWDRREVISINIKKAKDYAGNEQTKTYNASLKIPMDETDLKVESLAQTGSNEFQIVFNKAIEPYDSDSQRARNVEDGIFILRGGIPVTIAEVETDQSDPSKRTYRVILDSEGMPDYKFYGGKSAVEMNIFFEEGALRDVFGNTNRDIAENLVMTKDSSGPKIINVRATWKGDAFVLRFDEELQEVDITDLLHIRKGGMDVTSQFSAMPFEINSPNLREVKMTHHAGGASIGIGTYTIILDEEAIPDRHWNYNSAQNVQITIR